MSDVLSKFCPFFIQIDHAGRIVTLGPSMAKVLGVITDHNFAECNFLDYFQITRPANFSSISSLVQNDGAKLSLCLRAHSEIRMKATLSHDVQSDMFFLSPSFGIGVQAAIGRFGLTMTDFATTDMVPELLYLIEANQAAMQASKRLTIRLQGAKAAAEEQAHSDTLTGLGNRRALDVALDHLITHRQKFSIIQMDLDRFKAVNDTYGHAAGDAVLTHVAKVMRRETRQCDILVRLGGMNF
jgi:PleD family two-component response regulator